MTPQEKELIQSVFNRLGAVSGQPKDPEVDALIREQVARLPDAAYGLVQAVIMQEIGLNQAQQQIAALQQQLQQQAPAQSGSFLGGANPWGGSVPNSGRPQAAWGQQPASQPVYAAPQPQYQQPQAPQYAPQPQYQQPVGGFAQAPSAGGSFLRNAATMAAGVAGGTLIAEGISSMFGGHRGFGGGFGGGMPGGVVENVTTVNNYYGDSQDSGSGYDNAGYDDSGFDSGGFDDTSDA